MNNEIFLTFYSLAHKSNFLDWLIVFSANNFGYIMIFLAVMFLIFHTEGVFDYRAPFLQFKKKFWKIFFVFSSGTFAWVLFNILKNFIFSPRPFLSLEGIKPLFLHGGVDSFPSGHAVFFSAFAMSLFFINKKIGVLYFIVALIVGFARIASGVHFPLDILAGYILGVIVAIIFKYIFSQKSQ